MMRRINTERLNVRITLQTNTPTRSADGGQAASWADTVTVWAEKSHKSAREFFAAQRLSAELTDLFIIRYRSDVTVTQRVKYGTHYYGIVGAFDPDARRRELHLLCKEVT